MTQQIINIGTGPNDGTGDPVRSSFDKCNLNFTELYQVSRPTGQAIEYQFNNTVTEPPTTGQIRFNQATQASTTKIWVSQTTSSGVNIKQFLAVATTGAKLVLQDKIDNTNYIKFDVTGAPVDKTTYWEFAVAVTASGGNLPNAAILAAVTAAAGGGGTATPVPPQGRLTLATATPVMTTTQAAQTTIFYTPYVGNKVPIYDGTNMTMTTFAELSVATTDTTKNPSAVGASQCLDWFIWSDAGTLRISHGPAWTSDTVRSAGTALVMVAGILLNNASITNACAAQRGTYVGTTRSNASSQLDWIFGTAAAGGGAAFLGVWNCYNRVNVGTVIRDSTANWTIPNGTIRALNGSNGNRASAVVGLAEDVAKAAMQTAMNNNASYGIVAIGFDSASAIATDAIYTPSYANGSSWTSTTGQLTNMPGIGFHFWQAVEYSSLGTTTIAGDYSAIGTRSGLEFLARM